MKRSKARSRQVPGGERIFQRIYTRIGCEGRPPHFVVEYHPYADLTHTIRLREDTAYVRISDLLRDAPRHVFESAAGILLGRLYRRQPPGDFLATYRKYTYAHSTRRRLLVVRQRRARRVEHRPAGKHHDLGPMFERLNARYVENLLVKPRLGWSNRVWRTQLGCFDPALEQIVINRQLDRKNVPEYVVAYVLYHEMLHLKHPVKLRGSRRCVHSPEFQAEEKLFPRLADANAFLKRL